MSTPASGFNLFFKQFFSVEECRRIVHTFANAQDSAAPVYGATDSGVVNDRVRKVAQLTPDLEIGTRVIERLIELKDEIGNHFAISLDNIEQPQFLRYRPGDFFVAHQDGNTGLLRSEREQRRKVSVIIFLNGQSDGGEAGTFTGGSLVFSDYHPARPAKRFSLGGEPGLLVAFPAETTHEVIPVTAGERYSIVSWYGVNLKGESGSRIV
jgi:SM-20-related protein